MYGVVVDSSKIGVIGRYGLSAHMRNLGQREPTEWERVRAEEIKRETWARNNAALLKNARGRIRRRPKVA